MLIYILGSARFGKTFLANDIKTLLNGAIILDEPLCETTEQIDAFIQLCKSYSSFGDVIVIDNGTLAHKTHQQLVDIADISIFCKINDPQTFRKIELDGFNIEFLEKGEYVIFPKYDNTSIAFKEKIFAHYLLIDVDRFTLVKAHSLYGKYNCCQECTHESSAQMDFALLSTEANADSIQITHKGNT